MFRFSAASSLAAALSVGACSSIIGLSDYAIDPSLDAQGGAAGSDDDDAAGESAGGQAAAPSGGGAEGGSSAGQAGAGLGLAGEGARCQQRCDDEIDCTVDGCDEDGACLHTPDSTRCDADPGECVQCEAGIGCVAAPPKVTQLLEDASFDAMSTGSWRKDIQDTPLQKLIINRDPAAHSPEYSAWWLPAPPDSITQAYVDLLQNITIPPDTLALRLTGFYKLFAGTRAPSDDFTKAAVYDGDEPLLTFHIWGADEPPASEWTAFEYELAGDELGPLLDLLKDDPEIPITFDIYGYTWDSTYYFDTLSLEARSCE